MVTGQQKPTNFIRLLQLLHMVTRNICIFLLAGVFLLQLMVVLLRYVFGIGFLELQDGVAYAFAALVVLGLPVALKQDAHVRVDVFRSSQSPRMKLLIDRFGHLFFLIPVFAMIILNVWPDIVYSWSIHEGSSETGGLPGLFLVKSCLPLAAILMLLQSLAIWFPALKADKSDEH